MKKQLFFLLALAIAGVARAQQICDYAVSFPGSSSYIDCGPGSGYNAEGQLTVEAWVNLISTTPNQKIAGNIDPFTNSGFMLGVENGGLYCEVKDTLGLHAFTAPAVPSGEWAHLAFTYKVGGRFRGYVNGIMVADVPATNELIGDNGTTNFRIGAAPWDPNYFEAYGLIDEVRVYNIEKSVSQIREQMHVALSGPINGLIGYWRFSEGTGINTADLSGYNHTGTLTGFTLPIWQVADGPYGTGTSDLRVGTGVLGAMNFLSSATEIMVNITPTTDTFVVSKMDCEPGGSPPVGASVFNNGYWIVDRYSSATPLSLAITFGFPSGTVSAADSVLPSNLLLYNRGAVSTLGWNMVGFSGAAAPSTATVTFPFVSALGQFKVGSNGSSTLNVPSIDNPIRFSVAPNPAVHEITLTVDENFPQDAELLIYTSSGQVVRSQHLSSETENHRIDVSELSAGLYQVAIKSSEYTTSQRLIINR